MIDTGASSYGAWIPPALTAIGSFATAVFSYVLLRTSDAKKDERTYQREKAARLEARRDAIIERRNSFQRETLISLQEAAARIFSCMIELSVYRKFKNEGALEWEDKTWPLELSERIDTSRDRCGLFAVRVLDNQVRERQKQFELCIGLFVHAKSSEESERHRKDIRQAHVALNERIGEIIRQLDSIEPPS